MVVGKRIKIVHECVVLLPRNAKSMKCKQFC